MLAFAGLAWSAGATLSPTPGLSLAQVAAAVAIIVITATKLSDVELTYGAQGEGSPLIPQSLRIPTGVAEQSCSLGARRSAPTSVCTYVYVVAGASLAVSAALALVLCTTCNLCGAGVALDVLFAGAGVAWWGIAAGVVTSHAAAASAAGTTPTVHDWRAAVVGLCWSEAAICVLMLISDLASCC